MIYVALGLVVAVAAVLLSRVHLQRVERVTSGQTNALAIALKRLPPAERLAALASRAPSGSFERRLADELSRVADEETRGALINDVLVDVDLALGASSAWPSAATRIAAYGCLFFAALSFLAHVSSFVAVCLVIAGVASAAACVSIGERAETLAREQRKAMDALVDALILRERTPGEAQRPRRSARS